MADYYSLLARAIAALPQSTPEARHSVYERARKALFNQLRSIQPPVAEADIDAEGRALDEAIARLEAEAAVSAAIAPAAQPAAPPPPAASSPLAARGAGQTPPARSPAAAGRSPFMPSKAPAAPVKAPVKPAAGAPESAAPAAGRTSWFKPAKTAPPAPAPATPELAKAEPSKIESAKAELARAEPVKTEAAKPETSKPEPSKPEPLKPAAAAAKEAPKGRASFLEQKKAEAVSWRETLRQGETSGPFAREQDESPAGREAQRPAAPLPPLPEPPNGSRRLLAILAILIVFVGVVALAAWQFRERPEDLAKLNPEEATTETAETGKFADRIEGEPGAEPAKGRAPAVPVAQKAEMWVASATEPNKVDKIYPASVLWRLENVGGGPGEPVASAIRGDVDVPDAKLKMSIVIRKNADATLSASHTINVSFKPTPGADIKGVKAIFPIQMRRLDAQVGEKLVGIPVPIMENNFLIGLMRGDHEARNLLLLRSLMVLDLPFQLSDGRAATINMEKGASGERVFADALAAWGQK